MKRTTILAIWPNEPIEDEIVCLVEIIVRIVSTGCDKTEEEIERAIEDKKDRFLDLGINHLEINEIVNSIECQIGVVISDDVFIGLRRISQIIKTVRNLVKEKREAV